ncbi:hypothetical protein HU200_033124 [Digitaria exilis]|uniref:Uncharacterized protein n=1 Tax=Digitaria exilis TaxID=1010633 RepID=A0A835ERD1_9POAL|nr:hypothetical protein HU200_033124 [Digitaria exilis]
MATLPQRFKLLATRCAAGAPSPSRSPAPAYAAGAASPGYRLRRRVRGAGAGTNRRRGRLRRFLCRRGGGGPEAPAARPGDEDVRKPLFGGRPGGGGRTLRDLFVASPEAGRRRGACSCDCGDGDEEEYDEEDGGGGRAGGGGADPGGGGGGAWRGSRRFGSGGLRSLLMRRSWRPVLVAIPEAGDGSKIELGAIEE